MDPGKERRSTRRFRVSLAVMVTPAQGHAIPARTRDISLQGICFYLSRPLAAGTAIHFRITLPADVTLSAPVRIQCLGQIVRVEESPASTAIAAIIQNYQFLAD
jgi:hypothetical protein